MPPPLLPRQLKIPNFQIDANVINGTQNNVEMNQLETWFKNGVILINMSHIARDEAKNVQYVPRIIKADAQIYTIDEESELGNPNTPRHYDEVCNILFPNGTQKQNQVNDVLIVCEAIKYAAHLITTDGNSKKQPGGILGNKNKLAHLLNIFSPTEAVTYVQSKIVERDSFNRQHINNFGGTLPPWTYLD